MISNITTGDSKMFQVELSACDHFAWPSFNELFSCWSIIVIGDN